MGGNETYESLNRRRSSRMILRIPLVINSVENAAEGKWEQVETVVLSQHGGLIRTRQTYRAGMTIDVRRRDEDRSARARVVWVSSAFTPQGLDLGFEILDYPGFWGIKFPPDHRPRKAENRPLHH
jgi:PilZ domain-containing protein